MRKPTQNYSKAAEATLLEIQDQRKLRSDAIERLKACAIDVKGSERAPRSLAEEPCEALYEKIPLTTQESALSARRARREGLAALKRTTVQTMQQIKETTLYSAEEIRRRLEGEPGDLGSTSTT